MSDLNESYDDFLTRSREIHSLAAALGLLSWDQETYMPPAGVPARAGHRATLAAIIHDKTVDPAFGNLIEELVGQPQEAWAAANLREAKRLRDRSVKLPRQLVTDLAEAGSYAQQAWVEAKQNDDWALFEPHLARLVELRRQEAEAVGYEGEAYNALLDEYEPGARVEELEPIFTALRERLVPLLDRIQGAAQPPDRALWQQDFDPGLQDLLGRQILADIGFDFAVGRLDLSAHPFTQGMSPQDVRITTRYDESDLGVGLFANLHEGGHALYEMGLPLAHEATPVGQAVSLGIHESQSRLWENSVGRSRAFMNYCLPILRELFPTQMAAASVDDLYRAANVVEPAPIRIEADEVTYNLHIILRLEVERALLRNDIEVQAVPALWREKAREYLGLEVNNDREGALQDIHWAFGCFGYFPTYTLGNLYAAQFYACATRELPGLEQQFAKGEFAPMLGWLREKVHARGSLLPAGELCREVTGAALSIEPYLDYLTTKFGEIYGFDPSA